jgi:hypothetical protein
MRERLDRARDVRGVRVSFPSPSGPSIPGLEDPSLVAGHRPRKAHMREPCDRRRLSHRLGDLDVVGDSLTTFGNAIQTLLHPALERLHELAGVRR